MKQQDFHLPLGRLRDIFTAAIPFVAARRKATGGFGATPRLPATAEDTFHALRILELALKYGAVNKKELDLAADGSLRAYLAASRRSLPGGIRTLFHLLRCYRVANLDLDRDSIEGTIISRMRISDSLDDWYYGTRALDELLVRTWQPMAEKRRLAAILDRDWRTVDEAWMHIHLSWNLRKALPLPKPELVTWLRSCQNGDGGFGFFPGTTSFVENCHAVLKALAFLGAQPLDPTGAFLFLGGCQTASGGFGRSSRAAPFLDATWHALAAISFLKA